MARLGEPVGGHFFSGGSIDRAAGANERRDPAFLAETLAADESIISRDCFDIQQFGSIGTVRQPAASYYPVCDASAANSQTESITLAAGTIVPNTYVPV